MTEISISDFDSLSELSIYVAGKNKTPEWERVELNLSECKFIEPRTLIGLTCLVMEGIQRGIRFHVIYPKAPWTNKYLHDIRWANFIKENYQQPRQVELVSEAKYSALPLWRVSSEYMDDYILQSKSFYQSIDRSKDWDGLENVMKELLNNVYDHSNSSSGAYVLVQYFPNIGELKIVVADAGVGLANNVRDYLLKTQGLEVSMEEAFHWAFTQGKSTQSKPTNRGYGLNTVATFMAAVGGKVSCYVSGGEFVVSPAGMTCSGASPNLLGTLYVLSFRPKSLQDAEVFGMFDWE